MDKSRLNISYNKYIFTQKNPYQNRLRQTYRLIVKFIKKLAIDKSFYYRDYVGLSDLGTPDTLILRAQNL